MKNDDIMVELGLMEGGLSSDAQVRIFQVPIMIPSRISRNLSHPEAVTCVEVLYTCCHAFFH